jgi:hypothetical protein
MPLVFWREACYTAASLVDRKNSIMFGCLEVNYSLLLHKDDIN